MRTEIKNLKKYIIIILKYKKNYYTINLKAGRIKLKFQYCENVL